MSHSKQIIIIIIISETYNDFVENNHGVTLNHFNIVLQLQNIFDSQLANMADPKMAS